MNTEAEFLVIGSGPAGISAALPLVEAGKSVLMIDGAGDTPWPEPPAPWRQMAANSEDASQSPKLGTPYAEKITAAFRRSGGIAARNFLAVGARSRGGLSAIWGGFVAEYDAADLNGWPVSAEELRPYYKDIVNRIGVSGSSDDAQSGFYGTAGSLEPALPIGPTTDHVRRSFRGADSSFALGLARNAMITRDRDGRKGCNQQLHCLWGCDRGAIYDSRFDLARLAQRPNFRLQDHALVLALRPGGGAWQVALEDGTQIQARKIILAAGCLASTALAAGAMPRAPKSFRLLNNPVMAMPFLVPARLGKPAPARGYSLAQLGYRYNYGDDYVAGALYELAGLPAWSFTGRLPLSRRGGFALFPLLSPAMLIATCYFPGHLSDNELTWTRTENRVQISIRGGQSASLPDIAAKAKREIRRHLRGCGAWLMPGTTLAAPGTDVHYAGTLPMGGGQENGTSALGELNGAPGIHVVDGAALPSLSAKYPTLTIMANAARIGTDLARSGA